MMQIGLDSTITSARCADWIRRLKNYADCGECQRIPDGFCLTKMYAGLASVQICYAATIKDACTPKQGQPFDTLTDGVFGHFTEFVLSNT